MIVLSSGPTITDFSRFALKSSPAEAVVAYSGRACWDWLMILIFIDKTMYKAYEIRAFLGFSKTYIKAKKAMKIRLLIESFINEPSAKSKKEASQ